MVYITRNKADSILRCTSTKMEMVGEVYPKKLYMFTSKELKYLLRYKTLMENPDGYFASFKALTKKKDSYTFVNEKSKPSYHKDINCECLKASFTNYIIPESIQAEGAKKCREFRKWFRENEELLEEDASKFSELLKEKYGLSELQKVEKDNTGIVQFIDLSVEELEKEIDELLASTGKFIHRKNVLPILKTYGNYYHKVKEGYTIPEITTTHTNKEIVDVLLEYKNQYKKPLENLLKTYFRAKYNPDLKYNESILKQLGFSPCRHCCR